MHNFGLNSQEQNKTADLPWQNNIVNLQKQLQQQQQLNNSASLTHLQSPQQQQYASHSSVSPATSQSTISSRIDQIIRTTLHDSLHMPKSTNSNNMPSSSAQPSPIIFNPGSLPSSTAQNFNVSSAPNIGLMSTSSPLTSFYDNNISTVDTLNNNIVTNINSGNSNLATKVSAHSASHSALAAAAALQSLNQSHLQRSHHLAQLPQSTRPPSNPQINTGLHGNNMPKLGITSTTSSDHHNHNHLALSSHHANLESVEISRFLQQQQQHHQQQQQQQLQHQQHQQQPQQHPKLPPGPRNPNSWQDQVNPNAGQGWLYASPYTSSFPSSVFPTSSSSLTTSAVTNMSNSNNMIGQEGDNNSATLRHKNDQRPSTTPNQPSAGMPNLLKQHYQWLENIRGQNSMLDVSKPPSQRNPEELQDKSSVDRLGLFTFNLFNNCVPGTNKLKKVVPLDSVEELRQSIYRGEFYTKFEDIAIGILSNQVIVPEFSIIDYIRRDKFSLQEVEKIEFVHKRCGPLTSLCLMELAHQRPYLPLFKGNETKPLHTDTASNLNLPGGVYPPQGFNSQIPDLKNNTFLPPLPGKSDTNFPIVEKNRRSSQSPSDTLSRSQPNNGPTPKILNAHSSTPQNLPNISLPSNQLPPPPPPPIRGQHSAHARSSPFQPMAAQNLINHRPQRPASTTGIGMINEPPMNMSSQVPRQPPAAHQSSARPNITGSNPNIAHAHSSSSLSGQPISAHMSSKTPQTPRLQAQETVFPPTKPAHDNNQLEKHPNKPFSSNPLPIQPGFPSAKTEIDPMTGLPVQTLMSLKQQDLVNREMTLKRVNTPHFVGSNNNNTNSNNSGFNQHGLEIARSPRGLDLYPGSRSPMNQHLQSLYVQNPSNLNNSAMFKGVTTPNYATNASMPPPSSEYHRGPNQTELCRLNEPRPSMMSPNVNPLSGANDSQLRQYSALMNAYQQQQNHPPPPQQQQQQHLLMTNKNNSNLNPSSSPSSLPYGLNPHNAYGSLQPSLSSPQAPSDAMHIDLQNHIHYDNRPNSQQSSPKQNKQRSIITGSASAAPKRTKKVKHSPPSSQQSDGKTLQMSNIDPNIVASSMPNIVSDATNLPLNQQENNPYQFDDKDPSPLQSIETTNHSLSGANMSTSDSQRYLSSLNQKVVEPKDAQVSKTATDTKACFPNITHSTITGDKNACLSTGENLSASTRNDELSNVNSISQAQTLKIETNVSTSAKTTSSSDIIENSNSTASNQALDQIEKQNTKIPEPPEQVQQATNNNNINPPAATEQSKYQKLYTKKAWLKNYDQEDQQRSKNTTDETETKMPIAEVKSEVKHSFNTPAKEIKSLTNPKSADAKPVKVKNEPKKKTKEETIKKPGSLKGKSKSVENASEPSGASSSEADSDDTSSLKSSGDKKLRRTPRRKVKPSSDKEQHSPKSGQSALKRGKKDKTSDETSKKRKQNEDNGESALKKTKKSKLASKPSASKSKEDQKVLRRQGGRVSVTKMECVEENDPKNNDGKASKNPKNKDQLDSKSSGSQSDNDTLYSSNDSDGGSLPSDDRGPIKNKKSSNTELKRNNVSTKNRGSKLKQEQLKTSPQDDDEDDSSASTPMDSNSKLKSTKKLKKKVKPNKPSAQSLSPTTADNSAATTEDDEEEEAENREELDKMYRRTGQKFLQKDPCYDIVPKSVRCLECRRVRQSSIKNDKASKQSSGANWDDFCRFYEFRKLRYNKSAQIIVAGFSDLNDAKDDDRKLWMPDGEEHPNNMSYKSAQFILTNVGSEFCKLVLQERAVRKEYDQKRGDDKIITWKRAVNGLRELCDVCATTLFNCHHVCERCGFVVCIDCHQHRARCSSLNDKLESKIKKEGELAEKSTFMNKSSNETSEVGRIETPDQQAVPASKKNKRDSFGWIYCAKNEEHSHDKLILTQIIAGDCLEEVSKQMHEVRSRLKLGICPCNKESTNMLNKTQDCSEQSESGNSIQKIKKEEEESQMNIDDANCNSESSHSTLKGLLLASNSCSNSLSDDKSDQNSTHQMDNPKEVKSETEDKDKGLMSDIKFDFFKEDDSQEDTKLSQQVTAAIEGCISSLPNGSAEGTNTSNKLEEDKLKKVNAGTIEDPFFKEFKGDTEAASKAFSWLCNGTLLVLLQPNHDKNIELFRKQWLKGKPVLVRGVDELMDINKWLPQWFGKEFGDYRSDLVDCRNGDIHRHSMKKYWEGFEPTNPNANAKKKTKDDSIPLQLPTANNEECSNGPSYYSGSALWRLKDWPPGQDFYEILPAHYEDFMDHLPLSKYTTRYGKLNLSCRLPKCMLKPDLGPKMYSAYGTSKFPERGTTNLHLDISDAINVMVYVSGAKAFKNGSKEVQELYSKTVDECLIGKDMKDQIRDKCCIPGALWHIFEPCDAQKMRDFLNKVSDERNISPEKRTDPIHDQTWYLDQILLDRLDKEYGVRSYPILQCMGDAILIPAGAPHQVKNLQNCIKVANDFVSPENVRYCLQLTNEFRSLPETHINQEDKLQIKNILYHSIKDSLHYIRMFENNEIKSEFKLK